MTQPLHVPHGLDNFRAAADLAFAAGYKHYNDGHTEERYYTSDKTFVNECKSRGWAVSVYMWRQWRKGWETAEIESKALARVTPDTLTTLVDPPRDQWEYAIHGIDGDAPTSVNEMMNELGLEGWECFAIVPRGENRAQLAYFKRLK